MTFLELRSSKIAHPRRWKNLGSQSYVKRVEQTFKSWILLNFESLRTYLLKVWFDEQGDTDITDNTYILFHDCRVYRSKL